MNAIFEALWNGNIAPYKQCGINDPEVEELSGLLARNEECLLGTLDDAQKLTFEKYGTCCKDYYYLLIVHAFKQGFSLGCSLLTEAMQQEHLY